MRATLTLVIGTLLGLVLATANVYLGLKVGWWESGGIIAALLGFMALRGSGSGDEVASATVVSQCLASSSAAMPGAIGLLGAIPALSLLGHSTPVWLLLLYGVSLGVVGVLIALLFREPLLVKDALPFPSGTAIAETVQALRKQLDRGAAWAALGGATAGAAVTWLRDGIPKIIPGTAWLPFRVRGLSGESLTLGFSVSPLLAGVGLLIGLRNGIGLLAGAVLAWAVLAPILVGSGTVGGADFQTVTSFLMWPGVALMVSAGLVALGAEWRSIARALAGWRVATGGSSRVYLALAASGVAVAILARIGFGVPLAAGAVLVVASVVAALVCARAVGETGIAPVLQLGQLTQASYGAVASPSALVNVAGGSIVAGSIVQTSQTMESFRVGQLIGVPPARQVGAALLGIAVGTIAALPAYWLLTRAYGLGTEALPAPFALPWKAMAEIAAKGTAAVPSGGGLAALIGLVAGAVFELAARSGRGRFLPSPVVVGVAFVLPAANSATIAFGSLLGAVIARGRPERGPWNAALGAGAIAGESIFGLLLAALTLSGVLKPG